MDYRLVETGGEGGINGGIMKPKGGAWPGNVAFYIDDDDLGVYCEKKKKAGGKVIVERQEVPGVEALGPGRACAGGYGCKINRRH